MTQKIIPINSNSEIADNTSLELSSSDMNDKHTATLKLLLDNNVGEPMYSKINNKYEYVISKKTKVVFILMPKWAQFLPPYGLARLSSVCKESGYETISYDYNIDAYYKLRLINDSFYGSSGENDFKWLSNEYSTRIESVLNPIIDVWLEDIVNQKPDVIGFSLYYTNVLPSLRMAKLLKERLPNTKIIVGGSHINSKWDSGIYDNVDHALRGEGEELILQFLDKIENNEKVNEYFLEADSSKKINIDQLPFPDYSDFDLERYVLKNTISTEISRGCVAKCTFCDETFFWRFRSRASGGIINEIEHQYRNYNTRNVLFLDSLVNGNIKELHQFAKQVIEKKLRITWNGYARADKRMDYEFYKDLKASGCMSLNYGVESGSQPVLDSMKKNITAEIIENNIKDGYKAGLKNLTQWMLGYPNERTVDIAKTFTLIWRIHWYRLEWISRTSCQLGANTRLLADLEKYNIAKDFTYDKIKVPKKLLDQWYTNDYENTKLHRLVRFKSLNILCMELPKYKINEGVDKIKHYSNQYSIYYEKPLNYTSDVDIYQDVEYEDFDYEVIKDPLLNSRFKITLVNEIFAVIRTLWRAHKKQKMYFKIKFDPVWDLNEYGSALADESFQAEYEFKIDHIGRYTLKAKIIIQFPKNPYAPWLMEEHDFKDFDLDLDYTETGVWY